MSLRKPADVGFTARQKLTLFNGTALTAEQALTTADESINFEMLVVNGVRALNISTAGIRPLMLKQHGILEPQQLRRLGFDALHLVDPVFCQEANSAYGAASVIGAFLTTPGDAVALAGSDATKTLNISVQQLLEVCAGAPTEALSVLQQSTEPAPLKGVNATTLLDTGLRAPQLKQLGINLIEVREMTDLGSDKLSKLGYTL